MRASLPMSLVMSLALACARVPASVPQAPQSLNWIHDDYDVALEQARTQGRLLFLDAWAPWCHSCVSMQSYVFPDPALMPLHDRFVWLALDTDKEQNAVAVAKFAPAAWPTFFVIDPGTERLVARWVGSASVDQLRTFLQDAERLGQRAGREALAANDPLRHLLMGDEAAQAERYVDAAALYAAALRAAPPDWARRGDVLSAQIFALERAGDAGACADLALTKMGETGSAVSAVDFAMTGAACAEALAAGDPRSARLLAAVTGRLEELATCTDCALTADDRSEAWRVVAEVRQARGDVQGARAAAERRLALLEAAAAAAPNAIAASTFNMARADTYISLGRGAEAIPALLKSEAALPEAYDPPYRLARVYRELGQPDQALAALDRALQKAYGPRRAMMLGVRADILEARGDRAGARTALEEQIRAYRALPAGQERPEQLEKAEQRLTKLKKQGP